MQLITTKTYPFFGTKLVNIENLNLKKHSLSRMKERGINKKEVIQNIKYGVAYDASSIKKGRILVINNKAQEGVLSQKNTIILIDNKQEPQLVTVMNPSRNKWICCKNEDGELGILDTHKKEFYPILPEPSDSQG